jgi:hypothetical protein
MVRSKERFGEDMRSEEGGVRSEGGGRRNENGGLRMEV